MRSPKPLNQRPSSTSTLARVRRRGAAVVEFAIVAPIAILLVLGAVEFGRAMMLQHVAVNTARSACRQAILGTSSSASVQSSISSNLQTVGITGGSSSILVRGASNVDVNSAAPGDTIQITVTIPYSQNSLLPSNSFLGGKALIGRVTMAKE
jgi:Flp pilus assembly protein TadG